LITVQTFYELAEASNQAPLHKRADHAKQKATQGFNLRWLFEVSALSGALQFNRSLEMDLLDACSTAITMDESHWFKVTD
jgi:hypothetical protein